MSGTSSTLQAARQEPTALRFLGYKGKVQKVQGFGIQDFGILIPLPQPQNPKRSRLDPLRSP